MFNQVTLLGRLGRNPEVRTVGDNNRKVAALRVATDRFYLDGNGEKQRVTDWHSVVCWGKLAEVSERYLTTGRMVHVVGYLQTRNYDDRDGIRRWVTEVVATNLVMVGSGNGDNQEQQPSREKKSVTREEVDDLGGEFDSLPDDL